MATTETQNPNEKKEKKKNYEIKNAMFWQLYKDILTKLTKEINIVTKLQIEKDNKSIKKKILMIIAYS